MLTYPWISDVSEHTSPHVMGDIPKAVRMETGEIIYEKVSESPRRLRMFP